MEWKEKNLYSLYSASNVRRLCALFCPAISFLHFHVLQFHALQIGPSISRPSFSRPAFSAPPLHLLTISAAASHHLPVRLSVCLWGVYVCVIAVCVCGHHYIYYISLHNTKAETSRLVARDLVQQQHRTSRQRRLTCNMKFSYRRDTARQLRTSLSARSLNAHFTEHRISVVITN